MGIHPWHHCGNTQKTTVCNSIESFAISFLCRSSWTEEHNLLPSYVYVMLLRLMLPAVAIYCSQPTRRGTGRVFLLDIVPLLQPFNPRIVKFHRLPFPASQVKSIALCRSMESGFSGLVLVQGLFLISQCRPRFLRHDIHAAIKVQCQRKSEFNYIALRTSHIISQQHQLARLCCLYIVGWSRRRRRAMRGRRRSIAIAATVSTVLFNYQSANRTYSWYWETIQSNYTWNVLIKNPSSQPHQNGRV